MLLHIEQVLSAAELADINAMLRDGEFSDGRATAGYQSAAVKRNLQLPEHSALAGKLGDRVLAALERCSRFSSAALPRRICRPLFSCYTPGMYFGDHADNAIRGGVNPMRADVSVTLFLSEPADYDGGELIINDAYGAHHVKLSAGDLLLYPSGSLHRVSEVTRGARRVCFFWIQSMIRDNAQRQMLYELDQAIMGLQRREGCHDGSPEILSLINCYHNLLRLWAEV